jgi:hypothetical protein
MMSDQTEDNSDTSEQETPSVISWWVRDNVDRDIDDDRAIVLQPMRGEEIDTDLGPYVIEFSSNVAMRFFYQEKLDEVIKYLNGKYEAEFGVVSLRDLDDSPSEPTERDRDLQQDETF